MPAKWVVNVESSSSKQAGRLSPFRAVRTVLSAFIGIRGERHSKEDLARVTPLQIIVTAVLCAVILMGGLLLIVRQITT